MQKKRLFYISLSFIVSAVLIWILISQVETKDLVQTFSRIYFPAFLAFMGIALAGVLLRSWRYRWLLKPYPISWENIILVTFIRNLFVDLFPARIGSLSYIYLLNRRLNFSFEVATSTLVIAVIFDFITLSPFLFISIFAVGIASSALPLSALLLASLVFFLVISLILWKISQIFSLIGRGLSFLSRSFRLEGQKWVRISTEKIQLIKEHLVQSKKRKILFPLFFLSLFIRLAKYGSLYSLLRSHGLSLERISFWKTILGTTGAELTSALPIKGIGGFGTWESAWALTFRLMNFDSRLAILSGIGVHLLTNLFEYSLGIAAILILVFPLLKKGKKIK
jgi:uncharacterized membrane protein YbhN (UPF0104 family)